MQICRQSRLASRIPEAALPVFLHCSRIVTDHVRIPLRHTHASKAHQQLSVREVARTGDAGFVARRAQQFPARAVSHEQPVHSARG